ncbi:MAG: hypothetical protein QNJ33_11385 [Crocosphaera sp.]|nr:hypothetical protein [Crocosphaera sp.]
MAMKVLFFLKINKKDAKKENYGLAVWKLLLMIVFSGIISYLILLIRENNLTPIECRRLDKNNDGWVKCNGENTNQEKKSNP